MTLPAARGWFPFWFWNDRLEVDEIRRQVAEMAAKGVRGFIISPRQGMGTPYLTETYFDMVEAAIEAAQAHGLSVQIFDEYPYPSGGAGGEIVNGQPHFYATALKERKYDVAGGSVRIELPVGKVLCCTAYPLRDGSVDWNAGVDLRRHVGVILNEDVYESRKDEYIHARYFNVPATPVLEATLPGPHRVYVAIQTVREPFKYWGKMGDTMNPQAVKQFIELTHERYYQRVGKHFGKTVTAFFTDETSPMWTEAIPQEFRKRCGYYLLPLLPALMDESHPRHGQVAADVERVEYEMCVEAFDEPVSRWCREHGVQYWAEKKASRLEHMKWQDVPGCDTAHARVGKDLGATLIYPQTRGSPRTCSSVAYFYGKEAALCEAYHSMGWGANLQDIKWLADGLLLLGIDCLVPHAFYYSAAALRKHDAAPSFFFQMPYWELFGELTGHTRRLLEAIEGTWIDAGLLVVEPSPGAPTHPQRQELQRIQITLMEEHIDYLLIDVDMLEAGKVEGGRLRVKDLNVSVVVVPPMQREEAALTSWLARFEQSGGKVVRLKQGFDRDGFVRAVAASSPAGLDLRGAGDAARRVWCVTRTDGRRKVRLMLNTSGAAADLTIHTRETLRQAAHGDCPAADLTRQADGYRLNLAPYETVVLENGAPAGEALPRVTVPVGGAMRVHAVNANLLRLGTWTMTATGDGAESAPVKVEAMPLINQLVATKLPFAPAAEQRFGWHAKLSMPVLDVRYEATFENAFDGPVELLMQQGALAGTWSLRINDSPALDASSFKTTSSFGRGDLGVDVTPWLKRGGNRIEVSVKATRHDHGLRDPLYLAGRFAVGLSPLSLQAVREDGAFEAHEANGLPFYAGVIEYTTTVEMADAPAGDAIVELDMAPTFTDAAAVSINGGAWKPVPWSPRTVVCERGDLRRGKNDLRIRVYTSLIRAYDGHRFDHKKHDSVPVAAIG